LTELFDLAGRYGLTLTPDMLEKFEVYRKMLLSWNEKINLTAITEPREILEKHFLDSMILLKVRELPLGARVIDVGAGAGFPGIPLKIVREDINLTLLDSLRKRTEFLQEVSRALGQSSEVIHGRAEEAGHHPALRETFDAATARALAAMPLLCELCIPFVRTGGAFLALKGPQSEPEAALAQTASKILGGGDIKSYAYHLPNSGGRVIYMIEKSSQTPAKYPRKHKQMTKTPL